MSDTDLDLVREEGWIVPWSSLSAVVLIATLTMMTAGGLFTTIEGYLVSSLPKSLKPFETNAVMLSLENNRESLNAMDVALSLRGLFFLQPRSITICENMESAPDAAPVTPAIANRITQFDRRGISVNQPGTNSTDESRKELPLRCIPLPKSFPSFPFKLAGLAENNRSINSSALPLFVRSAQGNTEGTVWWDAIDQKLRIPPPTLLFGRILILNNFCPLPLNAFGDLSLPYSLKPRTMALDDFLFRMEEKERGTINPGFEEIFHDAVVFIAPRRDLGRVSTMAAVLDLLLYSRLSPLLQGILFLCWVLLFCFSMNLCLRFRILIAGVMFASIIGATLLLIRQGVLLPAEPVLAACLLIVIGNWSNRDAK